MNDKYDADAPLELGAVSEDTKGGPWGVDDYRQSLMLADAGLSLD